MIGAVAIREQLLRTIPWHFVKGLFFVKLSFSQRTAETKFDRLYLIIDEAHRGARNVKEQLTVMQKFINGSVDDGLSPLPVTVGVSATIERFNELVKNSGAAINPCAVPVDDVRGAGLLEDRIIVIYPDEGERDMSMLHAATLNWLDRCKAWRRHEVKPIFIVQVQSGTGNKVSDTNFDECLKIISNAAGAKFHVGEVVHTFGNKQDLTINGLKVVYREPSKISADERIKIALFELARLLNQTEIYHAALDEVINELVGKIRAHVEELKASGEYDSAAQRIRNFKISADVIDLERNKTYGAAANLFSSPETDTDRQFEAAKRVFARASSAYRDAYDENGRDYRDHLFVDEATGIARIKLNNWELGTLIEEQRRADFVCWLRNVTRKDRALSLVYTDEHNLTRNFYPTC